MLNSLFGLGTKSAFMSRLCINLPLCLSPVSTSAKTFWLSLLQPHCHLFPAPWTPQAFFCLRSLAPFLCLECISLIAFGMILFFSHLSGFKINVIYSQTFCLDTSNVDNACLLVKVDPCTVVIFCSVLSPGRKLPVVRKMLVLFTTLPGSGQILVY